MKVLVIHPAQQHSYRLAAAIYKKGWLYKYITTVYRKKISFTSLFSLFLTGNARKKAQGRVCREISQKDVVQFCEIEGLFKLLTIHIAKLRPLYKKIKYHSTDRFAKKVAKYAVRHQVDAVVSYDDYSARLFELLKKKAPQILRIMDVSAANILYMKKIYEKDMEIQPAFAERLLKEREIVWNQDTRIRTKREQENTDLFFVPSDFVARTLAYSGIERERIKICPYGVDTDMFPLKKYRRCEEFQEGRALHFIYVGGAKELKGISYLLNAIMHFPKETAKLTIVGSYNEKDADLQPYIDRICFTGIVLHEEIPLLLQEADVFVFPSLGEGFALSILEAASCGLPLIVSENSGVNDAITEGREGFVIPVQSTEKLVEKMQWFIEHPEKIEQMGRAARNLALHYTWDSYNRRISDIFDEIEMGKWGK